MLIDVNRGVSEDNTSFYISEYGPEVFNAAIAAWHDFCILRRE